jgi:hypothetical protein
MIKTPERSNRIRRFWTELGFAAVCSIVATVHFFFITKKIETLIKKIK